MLINDPLAVQRVLTWSDSGTEMAQTILVLALAVSSLASFVRLSARDCDSSLPPSVPLWPWDPVLAKARLLECTFFVL
jgi:hypothetical protein